MKDNEERLRERYRGEAFLLGGLYSGFLCEKCNDLASFGECMHEEKDLSIWVHVFINFYIFCQGPC